MGREHSSDTPFETVAGLVGEQTAEAFKILGNETRLAILVVLWEAKEPGRVPSEWSEPVLSFSELRDRVGLPQGSEFNYHLTKLTGVFVEQTEDGYTLTWSGEQVLSAVFAGIFTEHSSFEGEPIDAECFRCGAPIVIDYNAGKFVERCTNCEGVARRSDQPHGFLVGRYQPPVGRENRTLTEFRRAGSIWNRHRVGSLIEGVCPDCSGTVTTTIQVCEEHSKDKDTVCEHCGTVFEVVTAYACDICKTSWLTTAFAPIITEFPVKLFFFEHGVNLEELWKEPSSETMGILQDAVETVEIHNEEPLEMVVTVELDDDRLDVVLDEEAQVVDVTEKPAKTK